MVKFNRGKQLQMYKILTCVLITVTQYWEFKIPVETLKHCKIQTEALKINKSVLITDSDLCFVGIHQTTFIINPPNVLGHEHVAIELASFHFPALFRCQIRHNLSTFNPKMSRQLSSVLFFCPAKVSRSHFSFNTRSLGGLWCLFCHRLCWELTQTSELLCKFPS